MRRVASKFLFIAFLISSIVLPSVSTDASTENTSLWSGGITLESDELWDDYTDPSCTSGDMQVQVYNLGSYGVDPLSRLLNQYKSDPDIKNVCMVQNNHGLFGEGVWSPDGNDKNALEVKNVSILPVPAGDALVFYSHYGSDPYGAFRAGINYDLRDIGQLTFRYRGGGSNVKISKQWTVTEQEEYLHYNDGSPLLVRRWGFSGNGKFAVAALASGMIVKIDLYTQEVTPVMKRSSNAKNWRLAISNDGDYALSVDPQFAGLKFHDLSGCQTKYSKDTHQHEDVSVVNGTNSLGCSSHDMASVINELHPEAIAGIHSQLNFDRNSSRFTVGVRWLDSVSGVSLLRKLDFTPEGYIEPVAQGYLAMGDSYSSGEGDTEGGYWYESGTDEQGDKDTFAGRNLCHLSRRSYPYLIAVSLGYLSTNTQSPLEDGLFHSVACSGALIHNVIGAVGELQDDGDSAEFAYHDNQYRYDRFQSRAQNLPGTSRQLDWLKDKVLIDGRVRDKQNPEVITIGIGGNDAGFGDFLKACLQLGTCEFAKQGTDERTNVATKIATSKSRLVSTYRQIKDSALGARVYVHGYPRFIEAEGGYCAVNVALNGAERFFVDKSIRYMNQVIESAAAEAGVFYVDVGDIFEGRKLCSDTARENIVMNGATAGNDINPIGICFINCAGNETYHPTAEGFKLYKQAIIDQTNGLQLSMPSPVSTPVPVPDVYFGLEVISVVNEINNTDNYPVLSINDSSLIRGVESVSTTKTVMITKNGFMPASQVIVEIHSTPQVIGSVVVGDSGQVSMTVSLPVDIEPGYHELHVIGVDVFGDEVDYYQSIIIGSSIDDFDDDGVLNDDDSCPIVQNAFIDEDNDGIDDACDTITFLTQQEVVDSTGDNNLDKGQVSPETVAGTNEFNVGVLGASITTSPPEASTSGSLAGAGQEVLSNVIVGTGVMLLVFYAAKKRSV